MHISDHAADLTRPTAHDRAGLALDDRQDWIVCPVSRTRDTAFAPPFGTIRQCRCCGCLVAGGPTACVRCAKAGE